LYSGALVAPRYTSTFLSFHQQHTNPEFLRLRIKSHLRFDCTTKTVLRNVVYHSTNDMDSVNLIKIRTAAHRAGRSTDGLKYGWLNPFRRLEYDAPDRRANTFHNAEEGRAGLSGTELQHATTAPGNLQTQSSPSQSLTGEHEAATQVEETSTDSQATTAATTRDNNEGPRHRRRFLGVPLGKSDSEKDEDDLDDDGKPKTPKGHFTFKNQIQRTLLGSPLNLLLPAAPAGIIIWALKIPGPAVFVVNFIAIIPLAAILSDATEQIALRTGEVLGGLINATFG
jgi:Ca2+:H+ antiporter